MTPDTTTTKARKRRDRPFPWPCVNCLKDEVYPEKMSYSVKIKHDGRLHEIQIPEITIPKCRACGELVFSNSVDDQITDALRSHLRLLTPEQIKAGRKALGLKSKELAKRLGVADATVSRWEKRMMIQSRAMDNLLRVYFAVPEVRAALQGPNQDVTLGTPAVVQMNAFETLAQVLDKWNGEFRHGSFIYDDSATSFRSVVKAHFPKANGKVYGVYVVRRRDTREILYIGKGGTIDRDGRFKGQDVPGRLQNVRRKDVGADLWFRRLVPLEVEYWVVQPPVAPAYVEVVLLQAYLAEHSGRLPPNNSSL